LKGFDVVIVCTSTQNKADFWKNRLNSSELIKNKTKVYSVFEKWDGGAGQLLGTLNALEEVKKLTDLDEMIKNGCSVAIYHTAGKGKRIAPLSLAEIDKGAVRLPRLVEYSSKKEPITLLEAVIDQTSIFAETRKGRISVFWGDGLYIPSEDVFCEGKYHVELFGIRGEAPAKEKDWKTGWESYGLIIPKEGGSIQREKQSWEDFKGLVKKGVIKPSQSGKIILGRSIGCFSISYEFFKALLKEYETELSEKTEKLDTDPHLWMPLTSSKEDFEDKKLWDRVNRFKENFVENDTSNLALFGDKDLGKKTYWWDFGQLFLYHSNLLRLLEETEEGDKLRGLFKLETSFIRYEKSRNLKVKNSILLDSKVRGKVENCIVVGAIARSLNAKNSVIINSKMNVCKANKSVIYNCIDPNKLILNGETVVDLFHPEFGGIRMKTSQNRDGKKDWNKKICSNRYTYAEIESMKEGQKPKDPPSDRLK